MLKTLYWILFAVTMILYGTMLAWSLPAVSAAAGGLPPFDLRPGGYSLADAQEFLTALSAEGAAFYRNVQLRLDMAFPLLIGLTMYFALAALLPKRLGRWRYAVALPALLAMPFDYIENHTIGLMLDAGPERLTEDLVARGSMASQVKTVITSVVMTVILLALVWHAVRKWVRPRRA
ncbi:MAG TPA: hypothetical protein PK286_05415 [Devosia sp.]|nr:hypothetical protein [Devosia sp.]